MSIDGFDDDETPRQPPEHSPDWRPPMPPCRPGFGFWMAAVWCLLFLVVTQILAGLVFAVVILVPVVLMKGGDGGAVPTDEAAMMRDKDIATAMLGVVALTHVAGFAFGWLMLRLTRGKSWPRAVAFTRRPTLTHLALILIGMPGLLAFATCVEAPIMKYVWSIQDFLNYFGVKMQWPGVEAVFPLIADSPWILALTAVAIVPALNEELWCRGFLGQGLGARYGPWIAVLATSFFFGAIHLEPRQGLWAMFLGASIHVVYLWTRSLWSAILIHFLNNGFAVLAINKQVGMPGLELLEDMVTRVPILFTLSSAAFVAAVGYALWQTRCRLVPLDAGLPAWEPAGKEHAELPPPNSGMAVTHPPLEPMSVLLVVAGAVAFGLVVALA